MPGHLFSQAVLGLVACGQVVVVNNIATTVVNGVQTGCGNFTITRDSNGKYSLVLPAGHEQPDNRSFLFTQAYGTTAQQALDITVYPTDSDTKYIYTFNSGGNFDYFPFVFALYANNLPT